MTEINNDGLTAFLHTSSYPIDLTFECNLSGDEGAKATDVTVLIDKGENAHSAVADAAAHRIASHWQLPAVINAKNPTHCLMAYIQIEHDAQNWERYEKLSRAFDSVRICFALAHFYKQRCHRIRHLENTMKKEEFDALAKVERDEEAMTNAHIARATNTDAGEAAPLLERRERRKRMRADQDLEDELQGESSVPSANDSSSTSYAPTSPTYSPTSPTYSPTSPGFVPEKIL